MRFPITSLSLALQLSGKSRSPLYVIILGLLLHKYMIKNPGPYQHSVLGHHRDLVPRFTSFQGIDIILAQKRTSELGRSGMIHIKGRWRDSGEMSVRSGSLTSRVRHANKQASKQKSSCLLACWPPEPEACLLLACLLVWYDFFLAIYGVEEFKLLRQRYVGNKAHDATRYRRLKIPKLELGIGRYWQAGWSQSYCQIVSWSYHGCIGRCTWLPALLTASSTRPYCIEI